MKITQEEWIRTPFLCEPPPPGRYPSSVWPTLTWGMPLVCVNHLLPMRTMCRVRCSLSVCSTSCWVRSRGYSWSYMSREEGCSLGLSFFLPPHVTPSHAHSQPHENLWGLSTAKHIRHSFPHHTVLLAPPNTNEIHT